jgi:hypothetical protein
VEVGPADPDGGHPDDDLVRTGVVEVELDDLQGLADRVEQGGAGLQQLTPIEPLGTRPAQRQPSRELGAAGSAQADPGRIRVRIRRLQVKRALLSRPRRS